MVKYRFKDKQYWRNITDLLAMKKKSSLALLFH